MESSQFKGGKDQAPDGFRARNERLFARRAELVGRIAELRSRADSGGLDQDDEPALRRAEGDLDNLTCEIMEANYGLVRKYVSMFVSKSAEHYEDFESAGKVGLLWAISSFDPARGPFANWAFKPIQREVLRAVRDADHPNLNLGDFEKRPAILAAERRFRELRGEDAQLDHAAIAQIAGVTVGQVRRVLDPPRLDSLRMPIGSASEEEILWADQLPDTTVSIEDEVMHSLDLLALSSRGLPRLDERERHVLTRRFGLDGKEEESLRVIGDGLGLSREGVRQIQQKALVRLGDSIDSGTPAG